MAKRSGRLEIGPPVTQAFLLSRITGLLALLVTAFASPLGAQPVESPPMRPIAAPDFPTAIPLDSSKAPDGNQEIWFEAVGRRLVRNVGRASVIPVLPSPSRRTGAAVIIVPGGGFLMLSMDSEGFAIARRFAAAGIAAFVLKYRINHTTVDQAGFVAQLGKLSSLPPRQPGQDAGIDTPATAIEDGLAAMRLVRHAAGWNIDPVRVGMIGFSAGAMTTLGVVQRADRTAMPAFAGVVYGPMTELTVPENAPPLFAVLAIDDPLFGQMGYGLVQSWQRAKRPVELHVCQRGSHGFGLGMPGTTTTDWSDSFVHWISCNGIVSDCGQDPNPANWRTSP